MKGDKYLEPGSPLWWRRKAIDRMRKGPNIPTSLALINGYRPVNRAAGDITQSTLRCILRTRNSKG